MHAASLTNKEEQLSSMLLEDKNNQGGTRVCIFNGPQLVNQESTKIKKGLQKKSMQLFVFPSDGEKAKLNVRWRPVQWTTSSHQRVNRISPLLQVCVTTHFKRRKDKDIVRSTKHYATLKHIHVRVLSSKLDYAFYKIQVWGMEFFKTSHAMSNLSWSSLPLCHACSTTNK
jgi:hypothetical protein